MGSYKLNNVLPIMRIVNGVISFIMLPLSFYTAYKTLGEMPINTNTITGLIICEISYLTIMLGGYIMYRGAKI